jgi:hypothetical protein
MLSQLIGAPVAAESPLESLDQQRWYRFLLVRPLISPVPLQIMLRLSGVFHSPRAKPSEWNRGEKPTRLSDTVQ